jgi:hypothetical protein
MISEDNLDILQPISYDTSIESISYHTYKPFNQSSVNYNDEIRIPINSKEIITLPHLSYLFISGKVEKGNGTFEFDYNGLAYLFKSLTYELNGVPIDHVTDVGITTTMKSYLSISEAEKNYFNSLGFDSSSEEQYTGSYDKNSGLIQLHLPLSKAMGYFEDVRKIILNASQEIILIRARDDSNVFVWNGPEANGVPPKFSITEISWKIPHIKVSDAMRIQLLNVIKQNRELYLPFRTWELYEYPTLPPSTAHSWAIKTTTSMLKPLFVVVGFQTKRKNNYSVSVSKFDHIKLRSFQLFLNDVYIPYETPMLDMEKNQCSILYEMFAKFYPNFYQQFVQSPSQNMTTFLKNFPLIVLDCSRQKESISSSSGSGPLNVRFDFTCSVNVAPDTTARCLILYDRAFSYRSMDGIVNQIL